MSTKADFYSVQEFAPDWSNTVTAITFKTKEEAEEYVKKTYPSSNDCDVRIVPQVFGEEYEEVFLQ